MLINFFLTLRKYKVPVTIRELMDLLAALQHRLVYANIDDFYLLSRTCLVKDEKHYDKFDRAFAAYFKGLEDLHGLLETLIPDEWLRREFEKSLTPEELEKIKSLGGLEKLKLVGRGDGHAGQSFCSGRRASSSLSMMVSTSST